MAEVTVKPEDTSEQMAKLEQYANATKTKVVMSQSDLDTKDHIMDELLNWCIEQENIVILRSATILSSDPIPAPYKIASLSC